MKWHTNNDPGLLARKTVYLQFLVSDRALNFGKRSGEVANFMMWELTIKCSIAKEPCSETLSFSWPRMAKFIPFQIIGLPDPRQQGSQWSSCSKIGRSLTWTSVKINEPLILPPRITYEHARSIPSAKASSFLAHVQSVNREEMFRVPPNKLWWWRKPLAHATEKGKAQTSSFLVPAYLESSDPELPEFLATPSHLHPLVRVLMIISQNIRKIIG